ncbi:MAG: hypothetical protein IKH56_08025 [Oscillospiraceae bacterium]|nr:hypothetical protein [Oscillospiraceae bacterium]
MSIQFDCLSIDNNAIHIVLELLFPFLKYDSDSEYRVLNLDDENISKKHLALYEAIYLPYCTESRKHHQVHHSDGCFYPDSWYGEQTCLSQIHYLNQKAWWLLWFYAIKEAIQRHCNVTDEITDRLSSLTAHYILDVDMSIPDAVSYHLSSELGLGKDQEELIVSEISNTLKKYNDAPSFPMKYR